MALLQQVRRQIARSTAPSGRWPAAGRSGTDRPVGWPGRRRWPRRGWAIGTDFGKLCGAGRWSGGRTATLHPPERPTVGSVCKWGPGAAKCSRATCFKISLKKVEFSWIYITKRLKKLTDELTSWVDGSTLDLPSCQVATCVLTGRRSMTDTWLTPLMAVCQLIFQSATFTPGDPASGRPITCVTCCCQQTTI